LVRSLTRGLQRLEERAAIATKPWIHSVRILLVDPVEGCTGVIVMETGKPNIHVDPTPEEVAEIRADLEKHKAGARNR
jgi:hypothetical protein